MPSKERPPYGSLLRAPLLEAQVEIAVTARDVVTARRAADELRSIRRHLPQRSPALGEHLRQAVATGTYCCYQPDPRLPTRWEV